MLSNVCMTFSTIGATHRVASEAQYGVRVVARKLIYKHIAMLISFALTNKPEYVILTVRILV